MTMTYGEQLIQLFISGIVAGSMNALVAVSLGLIFSTTRTFHLAHSFTYAIGAYIAIFAISLLGVPFPVGIVIGLLAATGLGMGMEKFIYRPLRKRKAGTMVLFLVALGLQIFGTNMITIIFGPQNETLEGKGFPLETLAIGNITITTVQLFKVIVSAVVIAAVILFLKKSQYGRAITAVRCNVQMAQSVGISVSGIYMLVFALGSAIAGLAAILYSMDSVQMPNLSTGIIMTAMVTIFFGGVDSLPGAVLAGMIIGFVPAFSSLFITMEFAPVIVFGILYVILIIKPNGLMGKMT